MITFTFGFNSYAMDLTEVEKRCCVVSVSDGRTAPVSCSGVIVHSGAGVVLCAGLPFSRFLAEPKSLSRNNKCLSPDSFPKPLQIRLSLGSQRSSRSIPEFEAELVLLVNCQELKQSLQSVFLQTDQWGFHGNVEDEDLVRNTRFLSWFAVLKTSHLADSGVIKWRNSSSLQKGDPVVACGSPFGSLCLDLFINTVSRGIVSNLAGDDNVVILTDARCLPGTEGGGVFGVKGPDRLHFIGMIVSPFGWKANEWIGLSIVCSFQVILRNILSCVGAEDPLRDLQLVERNLNISTTAQQSMFVGYPTVCLVDSGSLWGSGVVVSPDLVLTCRHVVHGRLTVTLKFHQKNRVLTVPGDVLFSTSVTSPYDVAVVQMRESVPHSLIPHMAESFSPGDSVLVVSYGGLGQTCGPSLTSGIISKTINLNNKPVMLQTTCAVQAGASGGAVVRRHSGELLGIVSSNTRDLTAKVTYPHLNFSVPVTVLQSLLHQFTETRDADVWKALDTTEEEVRRVWRLQDSQSKL